MASERHDSMGPCSRRFSFSKVAVLVFLVCGLTCACLNAAEEGSMALSEENHGAVRLLAPFYKIFSRLDGKECPMHPTCSRYGFDAINRYGLIRGWIMTCDRLIRCGRDECRLAEKIIVDGKIRYHDPLPEHQKTD